MNHFHLVVHLKRKKKKNLKLFFMYFYFDFFHLSVSNNKLENKDKNSLHSKISLINSIYILISCLFALKVRFHKVLLRSIQKTTYN